MPDQKGSLKDRIRSWILFLNYKKELKKRQKEEKRKQKMQKRQIQILASGKYYSKPKVFGLTILGLFFGLFEGKQKKEIKSLEERINVLEHQINNNYIDNEVIKEIENIEKDIFITKKRNNNITINKCTEKLNKIKSKVKNTENREQNKIFVTSQQDFINKDKNSFIKSELDNNEQANNIYFKEEKYVPILEIKIFNKDLKKYNKDLNNINNKIKNTQNYDELYEYEFLIKQIKLRLNELLNRYDNLKQTSSFIELIDIIKVKDIDEFDLRKDNKKIKESISWCENALLNIENKKKELLSVKKINSEVKKTEKKEEPKKEEKKKTKLDEKQKSKLLELMLADKVIYDSIAKEKRKISRFNRQLSMINIRQRKPNIFYYTKHLVSSIVNLSFSIFPMSLFKNKILGGLVGGVMINNSLRSVRKILRPDIKIEYIYTNIEKEIMSASNYLNKMASVCDDSLKQIEDIRNTLYVNYGNDINYSQQLEDYLLELSKIEGKIKYEQATLCGMNEDLKIVKEKNKQKVKLINHINN